MLLKITMHSKKEKKKSSQEINKHSWRDILGQLTSPLSPHK